jgi:hypothetical protein
MTPRKIAIPQGRTRFTKEKTSNIQCGAIESCANPQGKSCARNLDGVTRRRRFEWPAMMSDGAFERRGTAV